MHIIKTPHRHNAGYLLNNQNARNKQEADIQCCTHCETVIQMQKWSEDGGWCGRCNAPICGPCADRMLTYGCEPFIKKLEAAHDMSVKLSQFRKLAGLDAPPADYQPKILVGVGANL